MAAQSGRYRGNKVMRANRDPNTAADTYSATATQPNGILEFLKRPVSDSATTAGGLEAPHGKHKHFPLQSPTVGKHDWWMMTTIGEAYATRILSQLSSGV